MYRIVILLLLSVSCSKEDSYIDPELITYVNMFYEDAAKYGIDASKVYYMDITFEDIKPVGWATNEYVHINRSRWDKLSEIEKIWVIYHELGHGMLNLRHSDKGIMQPFIPMYLEDAVNINKEIKELFYDTIRQ